MFSITALLLLAGCAGGDFGEVSPTLASDEIHDWVGLPATHTKSIHASEFVLTEDERELRDFAFPLMQPVYDRQRWYSVASEYGKFHRDGRELNDRSAYFKNMMADHEGSPDSSYAQLTDDILNDIERLPHFFEVANRVADLDEKRRKSIAYISGVSRGERLNVMRRINENARVIAMVRASLLHRGASYRFALEHLVLRAPSSQSADVNRLINQLQAQVTFYQTNPSRPGPG